MRGPTRFAALLSVLGALALLGALAPPAPAAAESPEIRRHGAACPPAGCAGRRGSGAASSLGFGLAVLASGAIAHRSAARRR